MSGTWSSYTHIEGVGCGCSLKQEISQPIDPQLLAKRKGMKKSLGHSNWFRKLFRYFRHDVSLKYKDSTASSSNQFSSNINENMQNDKNLQKNFRKDPRYHLEKKTKDAKNPLLVHFGKTEDNRDAYANRKRAIITTQVLNLRQKQSKDCKKRFVSVNTQNQEASEVDERLKNAIIKPRKVYNDLRNGIHYVPQERCSYHTCLP